MKYLEPISLEKWIQTTYPNKTVADLNFEKTACKLTHYLYRIQEKNTPVTLNSILSAVILKEKQSTIKLQELMKKSTAIYEYVQNKPKDEVITYMAVKPS